VAVWHGDPLEKLVSFRSLFPSMENVSVFLVLVDLLHYSAQKCGTANSELATNVCLRNVVPSPYILDLAPAFFYVLLTVNLSIILVIDQLNTQVLVL